MRPSRFADSQMKDAISQVDAGTPLVAMCRKLGITQTTFYRWRRKYGLTAAGSTNETRELREENQKLKSLVADLSLERQYMRESFAKRAKPVRGTRER